LTIAAGTDVTRKMKTDPTAGRSAANRRSGEDRRLDERRKVTDRRQTKPGLEGPSGRRQGVDRRKIDRRDPPAK
jgi:hypothetical protein